MSYVNKIVNKAGTSYDMQDVRVNDITSSDVGKFAKVVEVNDGEYKITYANVDVSGAISSHNHSYTAHNEVVGHYIHKGTTANPLPFDSVSELEDYEGTVYNHDYAFVKREANGNVYYDRYKADRSDPEEIFITWTFEYTLINSITATGILKGDGTGTISAAAASDIPGVTYLTTAPTADNTDGLKFVVLSAEPATKYNGYLYIITA